MFYVRKFRKLLPMQGEQADSRGEPKPSGELEDAPAKRPLVVPPSELLASTGAPPSVVREPAVSARGIRTRADGVPAIAQLAPWEKFGLTGSGAIIVGAALFAHLAVPVAVAAVFVGGGMLTAGLAFRRPLRSFRFGKSGFAAEADAIEESAAIAKDAAALSRSRLALVRSWTQDQQRILAFIAQSDDQLEMTRRAADFVRSRLADLTEELSESDESVRASVWVMSPYTNRLQFALGSEIEDPGKTFAAGEGIMGRSFAENEIKNVPDAPRRPEYANAEANEPFHGLLCIPLTLGVSSPIGVLCVDRTNAEIFPSSAVDLSATLAALLVAIVTTPQSR